MPKSKGRENHQRGTVYSCDPKELFIIGLDGTPEENKAAMDHPLYDARIRNPIDQRLVESMLETGWFGAIEVRREKNRDVVVAGRSRVRAARAANDAIALYNATKEGKNAPKDLIRIEYKIQRADDGKAIGVMISENELRTEDTIPNKARKLALYLAQNKTMEQARALFGVSSIQTLKNWLGLLEEKNSDVLAAVEKGKINPTAAYAIMKLDGKEREKALLDAMESGASGASVRDKIVRDKAAKKNGGSRDSDSNGDSSTPHEKPGVRLLKKLYNQDGSDLDPAVRNTIGWVLGYIGANRIKGLVAACHEVNEIVGEDE